MKRKYFFENNENGFLTTMQAAKILNISLSTLKKLIFQGRIQTFKTPGGHHRILVSDLLSMHKSEPSVEQANASDNSELFDVICAFTEIIETNYHFGRGHASAVSKISCEIARGLKLSESDIGRVARASLLHDIGMIMIPTHIARKEKPLTEIEYKVVRKHPLMGAEILERFTVFADVINIVKQHHEQPNGSGYPYGLTGSNICIEAKIISVAESFDCMTAEYSYKKAISFEEAANHIQFGAGTQFDSSVVNVFLKRKRNICEEIGRL